MKITFRLTTLAIVLAFLSACTGSGQLNDTLSPAATTSQKQQASNASNSGVSENALAAEEPPSAAENVTNAQTQTASLNTSDAMTFLPVEGAPQGKVTTLSKSIKQAAKTHGLAVLPANQSGAKYQVKGYFSALNDGSGTLLIYIWDIFDGSGKRLHRINGQERTASTETNPWQAISDKELGRVADATAQRLKSWVETN